MGPRRLQAPRQDGAIVAEPPLDEAGETLATNRRHLAVDAPPIFGQAWSQLRQHARQAAVTAAQNLAPCRQSRKTRRQGDKETGSRGTLARSVSEG